MGSATEDDFDFEKWTTARMGARPPIRERLMDAVDCLATSGRDISTRIGWAYFLMGLEGENELPENLRAEYRQIVERITRKKAYVEGARLLTVAKSIRGKKAVEAARAIVRLHRRLEAQSRAPLVSKLL